MTTETPPNVNVFLTDSAQKQRVFGTDEPDPNKNYIILQNDTYAKRNIELELSLKESQTENERLESEVDRLETSNTYMNGELKNFVELAKMHDDVAEHYKKMAKFDTKTVENFGGQVKPLSYAMVFFPLYIQITYMLSAFITSQVTIGGIAILTTLNLIGISGLAFALDLSPNYFKRIRKNVVKTRDLEKKPIYDEIKKIEAEIKRTNEANDILFKYIDLIKN